MKKLFVLTVSVLSLTSLAGCAHLHKASNDQTLSEFDRDVNVEMETSNTAQGKRLQIVENRCNGTRSFRDLQVPKCSNVVVGEAEVLEVVDADTARVRLPEGLQVNPSTSFRHSSN